MNKTTKPERICAIDASTNSLAFAVYISGQLDSVGKINFEGSDIYQKVGDAAVKTKAFFKNFIEIDAIVIEHTVFMNSPKTAADLALVQGALLGAAAMCGIKTVGKVSPITWQNYLGNKRLSKEEQYQVRVANPGKSLSWYKTYERDFRKKRTTNLLDIIYDKKIEDYDVADAAGIGHWAINNWNKAIGVDK
jgi:hypothetical protein